MYQSETFLTRMILGYPIFYNFSIYLLQFSKLHIYIYIYVNPEETNAQFSVSKQKVCDVRSIFE